MNSNKIRITVAAWLTVGVFSLLLSGCNEAADSLSGETAAGKEAVAFSTSVHSIRQATRADATIVNKDSTMLLPTAKSNRRVGIFGCYTGKYKWAELVTLSNTAYADRGDLAEVFADLKAATEDDYDEMKTEILEKYYSANQMFNTPATINADGTLTYLPLQFWPNNTLPNDTEHEYMTFWAYYPYNESSTLGQYGISMYNDAEGIGRGKGMGKVKFTMSTDAADHNDFLISAPVTDCNRDKYPLQRTDNTPSYDPKPVQFRLFHMLAQVRFYTYIRGDDKMVYQDSNSDGEPDKADEAWLAALTNGSTTTIIDDYGDVFDIEKSANGEKYTITNKSLKAVYPSDPKVTVRKEDFLALNLKIPDEGNCVRWLRTDPAIWDISHERRRANITYELQMNNIHTVSTFYPHYYYPASDAVAINSDLPNTLGSVTVKHYIMNPYWFTFQNGKRIRLNDNYMFGLFENTPVGKEFNASTAETLMTATDDASMSAYDDVDGIDWSALASTYDVTQAPNVVSNPSVVDPLGYLKDHDQHKELHPVTVESGQHYNYAPGNILLVVPQTLNDEDVPHVVITAKGKRAVWDNVNNEWTEGEELTAKVTVNLLKMGISWQSGFIYCYAFLDDLKPGDDKVRGPESITVLFNKNWYTDQW